MLDSEFRDSTLVLCINQKLLGSAQPNAKFDLVESAFASIYYYYSDIMAACSVYRSLIKNHPFFDANKRTASLYLTGALNSLGYSVDQNLLADLTLEVATGQFEVDEIATKLQSIITTK